MLKYILKRLLLSVVTLFIIATVVFLLMRLMPETGYFDADEYDKMDAEQIEVALAIFYLHLLVVELVIYSFQMVYAERRHIL